MPCTASSVEGRKVAKASFAVQKGAALAQAAINVPLAYSSGVAAPVVPPLNFVLGAANAAAAAAQVGLIAAQKPSFHIGHRAADEYPAMLRQGEAVVTAAGNETMQNTMANINAGVSGGEAAAVLMIDHVAAGRIIHTQLSNPSSELSRRVNGGLRGHSRKRGSAA